MGNKIERLFEENQSNENTSKEEQKKMLKLLSNLFIKYDKDKSGQIDREEFKDLAKEFCEVEFKSYHQDFHSFESSSEFLDFFDDIFEDCDADYSNQISFDEFKQFVKERRIRFRIDFNSALKSDNVSEIKRFLPKLHNKRDFNKAFQLGFKKNYPQIISFFGEKYPNVYVLGGIKYNAIGEKTQSYLSYLCSQNETDKTSIELLIKNKADLNLHDNPSCNTPLIHLCTKDEPDKELIKLFLDNKANPNAKNKSDEVAFHSLFNKKRFDLMKIIFEYKADPNIEFPDMSHALTSSFANDDDEMIKFLLENNASPNLGNMDGKTAFDFALQSQNLEFIKMMLGKGLQINLMRGEKLNTYLLDECGKKKPSTEILQLLLQHKADPNLVNRTNNSALHAICRDSELDMQQIDLLLQHKADVSLVNSFGDTAFNYYLVNHYLKFDLVDVLKSKGFVLSLNNSFHFSLALECSKENPSLDLIKFFLKSKADVNVREAGKVGSTTLVSSFQRPNLTTEIRKLLIENDGNPNIPNKNEETALHAALWNPNITEKDIQLLLEKKIDVNLPNINNETPLHILCYNPNLSVNLLKLFLELKCDTNVLNECGETPFCILCCNKKVNLEMVKLFTENKAEINCSSNMSSSIEISDLGITITSSGTNLKNFNKKEKVDENKNISQSVDLLVKNKKVEKLISGENITLKNRSSSVSSPSSEKPKTPPVSTDKKSHSLAAHNFKNKKNSRTFTNSTPILPDLYTSFRSVSSTHVYYPLTPWCSVLENEFTPLDVLAFFVEQKADVNATFKDPESNKSISPLATLAIHTPISLCEKLKLLLHAKADPLVSVNGYLPIHILFGSSPKEITVEIIELFLEKEGSINSKGPNDKTLLHFSLLKDVDPSVVKFLVEKGADPNLEDKFGYDVLSSIILQNDFDEKLFEKCSYIVDHSNKNSKNFLGHVCAHSVNIDHIKFFLSKGFDPKIKNNKQQDCIDILKNNTNIKDISDYNLFFMNYHKSPN